MDESAVPALTQAQLMKVSEGGMSGMHGPTMRRIDCMVPGAGIEVWGALVEFGGRYLLEDLHRELDQAHPPMFKDQAAALAWLVDLVNATPVVRDRCGRCLQESAARAAAMTEARRAEELAHARAVIEKAEKRARDTEITG